MKQYLGNKRQRAYDMGWLTVPEKYAYLQANASMRSKPGSRKKKGLMGAKPRKKAGDVSSRKTIHRALEEDDEDALEFNQTSDEPEDSEGEEAGEYESSG